MRIETPQFTRLVELDALRGLAALAVVAYHYTTLYGEQVGHVPRLALGFAAGNHGVELFFLISGFVIFMTLERTRTAMDFVVSRFSRLFPAYWVALAVTAAFVYGIGLPQQRLAAHDLLLNFTMLQQILGAEHLDGSYWTLQVELFFYLQMLVWFMLGLLGRIHWIIGAWLLLALAYGVAVHAHGHVSYTLREVLLLRHIPFFAMGILFYRLRGFPGERARNLCLLAACVLVVGLSEPAAYIAVALACIGVFMLFIGQYLRWLRWRPFAFLGAVSYSMYLLHQSIGFAMIHRLEAHGIAPLAAIASVLCLVLALSALLTYTVERPVMRVIRAAWRAPACARRVAA